MGGLDHLTKQGKLRNDLTSINAQPHQHNILHFVKKEQHFWFVQLEKIKKEKF